MLDLSDNYRAYDKGVSQSSEMADDLTALFSFHDITGHAELYKNGKYQGDFDLESAIAYACEQDDDDMWDIKKVEEWKPLTKRPDAL